MSALTPYIYNLEKISQDIPEIAKKSIRDNAGEIEDLLKYSQLGKGKNSAGQPLKWQHNGKRGNGKYAPTTPQFAKLGIPSYPIKPKIAGEPYNFEWSGDTFRMMGLEIKGNDEYEIFTRSGKQSFLESIYGEIFKLTEKHNKLVNDKIILPYLQKYILENMFNV